MGGHPTADLDRAPDLVVARLQHPQADPAVGEIDEVLDGDRLREAVVGDREPGVRTDAVLGGQHDLDPGRRPTIPVVDVADPQLRPGEVTEVPTCLPLRSAASRAMATFSACS